MSGVDDAVYHPSADKDNSALINPAHILSRRII